MVLSGAIAGYIMSVAGLWAGKVPGLMTIDIADFGRRYVVSDRPSAWLLGLVFHIVNSILLVLLWATTILPNLPIPRIAAGVVWGAFLSLTLAGALVAPLSGLGFLGRHGTWRYALTSMVLHVIWGVLVGLIYTPP